MCTRYLGSTDADMGMGTDMIRRRAIFEKLFNDMAGMTLVWHGYDTWIAPQMKCLCFLARYHKGSISYKHLTLELHMRPHDYHIVSGLLPPFVFYITSWFCLSNWWPRYTKWKDKLEFKSILFPSLGLCLVNYFFGGEFFLGCLTAELENWTKVIQI